MTAVDDILAGNGGKVLKHHGVKGMKWGYRKQAIYTHPSGEATIVKYNPKKASITPNGDLVGTKSGVKSVVKQLNRAGFDGAHVMEKVGVGESSAKSVGESSAKKIAEDHANVAVSRNKHISELSNKELSDMLNRIDLENRYAKMMQKPALPPKNAGVVTKGRKYVTDLLLSIGQHEMQRVARSAASIMVEDRLMGNKRDTKAVLKEAGNRMQPKQGKKQKGQNP